MTPRRVRSHRYGHVPEMSAADELSLAADIVAARQAGEEATDAQRAAADKAVDALIRSYSPFIERLAREHHRNAGDYGGSVEDFTSEAYLVATQCARSFDPTRGQTQIRFSSYFSRAVSSVLFRMSMRSRSPVTVPVTVMSAARKWAHTRYEAVNRGMDISDEDVSALSGVDGSQEDVAGVLGLAAMDLVEDVRPQVSDDVRLLDPSTCHAELTRATEEVFGEDSEMYLALFGLTTGRTLNTAYLMRTEGGYDAKKARAFMTRYRGVINHPLIRAGIAAALTADTDGPDGTSADRATDRQKGTH